MCLFVFHSNVTPQSRLDLKLWSCHTLRKELLGSATIDLLDTLRTHDGKSKSITEKILGSIPPQCSTKMKFQIQLISSTLTNKNNILKEVILQIFCWKCKIFSS